MPKTCTRCNSEPVLSARSAAVRVARSASSEPSVAKRTLVGKMLIWCPPHWTLALRLHDASRNYPARTSENFPWTNFRLCEVVSFGHHPQSETHGSGAWATGCFGTHVSARTPPPPGYDTSALLDLAHKQS